MTCLFLEIGAEEIPAAYIDPALRALSSNLVQKLDALRFTHGDARTFGTPRRLAIEIKDVSIRQAPLTTEITGPPERVGFDDQGKPTVAAVKFAEKIGISVKNIIVKETKKGRYLSAVKTEQGVSTKILLKTMLPEVILALPFPKTMKWADLSLSFARPIHSLVALLGTSVIPFTLGNLKSGRHSFGHRFMAPGKIKLTASDQYVDLLNKAHVEPEIDKRRAMIEASVAQLASDLHGQVQPDEQLVEIVNNLVEYPVPVAGKFDRKFLELPKEVLITAMREHQKYFAVTDNSGGLMPCFIAVNNTRANDMALVTRGHERVLRARLEDARFFYRSDIETTLDSLVIKLKDVIFQSTLGSVYEKTLRIQKLGKFLADKTGSSPDLKDRVSRAAWLCKADLTSQVVIEFPKLQGTMGRVYAVAAGEGPEVAAAIEEHYMPAYSGGPLPGTLAGALLALADKTDSICGYFKAGLIPTGASDPYALRRQSIGIIQIVLSNQFSFSLRELIQESMGYFNSEDDPESQKTAQKIYSFLKDRIAFMLSEQGFQKDVINAVTAVSVDHVPDTWKRVKALEELKNAAYFEPLAIAFKRAVNIIKKAEEFDKRPVNPELFEDMCESALHDACTLVHEKVSDHLKRGDFQMALADIASLRDTVDAFFDGVMVMAQDEKVRQNRLALLSGVAALFETIADFSKISPIIGIFNEIRSTKCAKRFDRCFAMINDAMAITKTNKRYRPFDLNQRLTSMTACVKAGNAAPKLAKMPSNCGIT